MPFMWQFSLPWKESDDYHRRFPYAPQIRREPSDGAPHVPGEPDNTLPGTFGPIALDDVVAYRVIEPTANDAPCKVEITIATAATRRVRFVDPYGRPVRGAVVFGLTPFPHHQVILDGDWAEFLALDATRERRLAALSPDGRLCVATTVQADSAEPITVGMRHSGAVTGRLADEEGTLVAGASASVAYLSDDPPPIPLPRAAVNTDAEGRFRVEGIFPGYAVTIKFYRAGNQPGVDQHYRPEALRKLVLDEGRTRDVGTVTRKSLPR
jgi:protocatechuate 3,4-dioxygenase beta subunit